jgi:nucleotide-binding universal stress UspA family protein
VRRSSRRKAPSIAPTTAPVTPTVTSTSAHVTDAIDHASDVAGEVAAWIEPHVRNRCRYSHVLASGNAAEETIRLAHDNHADLIVLGAQHKRFADATVLGTTTERVIRFAKRPVLAVVATSTSE